MELDIIDTTTGERRPLPAHLQLLAAPLEPFFNVLAERAKQDLLWGEQNHPDVLRPNHLAPADAYRRQCDDRHKAGEGSWMDIVLEELAEAHDEAIAGNTAELRAELVQLAAVIVAWIQAIDRRST